MTALWPLHGAAEHALLAQAGTHLDWWCRACREWQRRAPYAAIAWSEGGRGIFAAPLCTARCLEQMEQQLAEHPYVVASERHMV